MAELAIKIDCGEDKCMDCGYLVYEDAKEYCSIFKGYPETTISGTYRLDECKNEEITEIR